jgi:hypothetical protein
MKGRNMELLQECLNEYRRQLEKGAIQQAYRGLMEYIMGLRTHFMKAYPDYFVSGSIYYGYMDMTYFSVIPKSMKDRRLKIAIVFLHEPFRFEVWLSGVNRQVQTQYWELLKGSGWNKYRIVPSGIGVDSILESILVSNPDFNDLDTLTKQIERATLKFIQDVESFFSKR